MPSARPDSSQGVPRALAGGQVRVPDRGSCAGRSAGPQELGQQPEASVPDLELSHHMRWGGRGKTGASVPLPSTGTAPPVKEAPQSCPLGQATLGSLRAWPHFSWAWDHLLRPHPHNSGCSSPPSGP